MSAITDALWQRYRTTHDPVARAELLDHYLGLVHHGARELIKRCSADIELDDLIGAGTLGLVQALEGFDPERGLAFSTYAVPRIRGAMLDELRGRDWTPRSVRTRRRRMAEVRAVLQHQFGRVPDDNEMAAALEIDLATYWRWREDSEVPLMLALDGVVGSSAGGATLLGDTIADPVAPLPGDALTDEERLAELREALASLPARERLVLTLYYYEGLSLRQIGEVLHVTESRISQIRTRAFQRLRDRAKASEEDR